MAKQTINIGTTPNDGTGDTNRAAFDIANDNFNEIYDSNSVGSLTNLGAGTALTVSTAYYVALSAVRTLTFSGTPAEGNFIYLDLAVTGGPHVLTIPTSTRAGTTGTTTDRKSVV